MNPTECKHTLTVDFETYYSTEYSLRKMTTQQYILSPLFQVICVAVKLDDGVTLHFSGTHDETAQWLRQFPWEDSCLVAHNAMFDGAILAWLFQIIPKALFCTMMGSRPNLVPFTQGGRMSLAAVVKYLDLGQKGDTLLRTSGLTRSGVTRAGLMLEMLTYCADDVDKCYSVYKVIKDNLPEAELHMLSLTVRKFVFPQVYLDRDTLRNELLEVRDQKARALTELARELGTFEPDDLKRELMSNNKFAEMLLACGVQPPMKTSKTTGKQTFAFAKNDPEFKELLDHPDPKVSTLVETRMGVKSTQKESRLERFLEVRDTTKSGVMAVPLMYYGAHTGRFSGLDKLNLQNLPRGDALRFGIRCRPGNKFVVSDLSQVEARITAALCNQKNLVQAFLEGKDVYSLFSSDLFGRPITKADKEERFIGKQCILGLGFSMSWTTFQNTMKTFGTYLSDREARRIVYFYRDKYPSICLAWGELNACIESMAAGGIQQWGPVIFMANRVVLPNGMQIHYPDLQRDWVDPKGNQWQGWSYDYRGKRKKLYGGALLENIVQALARIILVDAEIALANRGIYAALSVHDELIYSVIEQQAPIIEKALNRALTTPVPWLPELVLASESDIGESYGDAK